VTSTGRVIVMVIGVRSRNRTGNATNIPLALTHAVFPCTCRGRPAGLFQRTSTGSSTGIRTPARRYLILSATLAFATKSAADRLTRFCRSCKWYQYGPTSRHSGQQEVGAAWRGWLGRLIRYAPRLPKCDSHNLNRHPRTHSLTRPRNRGQEEARPLRRSGLATSNHLP